MIVTILILIKKFLELMKNCNSKNYRFNVNLIESSTFILDTLNESSVVFMNCETIQLDEATNNSEFECFESKPHSCCLRRQTALRSKKQMINTLKKMEFEEDGHKDLLNGITAGFKGNIISPASDCNSNNLTIPKENMFLCSTDSIHDSPDFLQDNSEYQWFLDYGYKYNNSHHQSILSLSRSQDLIYYDDMARNIDANLAEVDMEDFNREDIHSVLSSLPNIQGVEEREMFASVTGSMMVKFDFDTCVSPRSNSQEEQINTSICKSQILFSPVRENYLPNSSLSVDSLELSENDFNLMVTCQSNKNNYTIAFEGSTVMTSDDSESRETCTSGCSRIEGNKLENQDLPDMVRPVSNPPNIMTTSDSTFTTWLKIKENPTENLHLRRHSSGNNNATADFCFSISRDMSSSSFKSLSLPNLFRPKQKQNLGVSLSVKLDSELKRKSSDCRCVKLYDIQSNSKNMNQSTSSASKNPAHNFSLVKLFIKQKSASHEGMSNYAPEEIVNNDKCKNSRNCQNLEKIWASNRIVEINNTTDTCLKNFENTASSKNLKNEEIIKTNVVGLNHAKHGATSSQHEHFISKHITSDRNEKKPDNNGYYSDESTQENGSNTESAENLMCNCINAPSIGNKKLFTEKSIQTSRVLESNNNTTQKKPSKVPVYILYPNYSLPNLEFLKREHYIQNIDFSKIFLKPQKFCAPESPTTPKNLSKPHGRRPFSVNDIETLKKTGFKHVKDWESLTFLLPKEYKQFLQEIPEIVSQLKDVRNSKEEIVPLFCLSPPPTKKVRKRPNSFDVNISNESRSSNFSSITTQPSSGYRGSSTMLNSNNSYNTNSPRNPSFISKYEGNSESGSSRKNGCLSHNKNHYINSDNSNESLPQRPPLPKSILRNNSLDSHQYTCKTQKEYANKRYSMVELTEKNLMLEEKYNKKRSLHPLNSKSPQAFISRVHDEKQSLGDTSNSNKSLKNAECQEIGVKSNLENDMRRLEELLEISSVFGESVESFTECDMMRLRSQVSKFLTMQKNLEKVSETLQTVDEGNTNESGSNKTTNAYEDTNSLTVKNLLTPHNTPEHKKQPLNRNLDTNAMLVEGYSKPYNSNGEIHEIEEKYCKFMDENLGGLKKTVSFAEKISFAVKEHELTKEKASSVVSVNGPNINQEKAKRPGDLPICEESSEGLSIDSSTTSLLQNSVDLLQKRELIIDVENAVKKILTLCKDTKEDPANICLHHLCPSLYAVLSDGLKEEINTPFGPIRNSVWSVIEASSQQGPMTQTLNELVQRLNRDEIFTEGLIKFNAFIFGLLNARALSGWFSYLRTRDSLLRKYYEKSGLLWMSNTARAPYRVLVSQLINIIEPLCSLQFNLDLMYQSKLLHCSLQNLNCLLEEPTNSDFLTPTKQFMLLKLVQSIQSSLSQSGEGRKSKHILENMEQKTSDPPVGQLLMENKTVRTRRGGNKTRPRSGFDSSMTIQETTDVASAMKKRWSGVNLNSKLVEAFDRLVDESESDYTDSLDVADPRQEQIVPAGGRNIQKGKTLNTPTRDSKADTDTKKQKKNILLNLNKKSSVKIEDCQNKLKEKEFIGNSSTLMQNGGQKFKRLQQKWERWEESGRSPSDSDSDIQSPSLERVPSQNGKSLTFKSQKSEKQSCDSNNIMPSPTSRISKIPRLVTSPSSSNPSSKPMGNIQRLVSPTSSDSNQKARKSNLSTSKGNIIEGKVTSIGVNRVSRIDEKMEPIVRTDSGKNQTPSTENYSHRRYSSAPGKKNESLTGRTPTMSLNRKPAAKKLHQAPRTVRTLTHRLPSDSGHLSFNAGEKLKVVLEVDKIWLLCCRGSQKGLVPKSLVISDIDDKF